MNKTDLIDSIAAKAELSKNVATDVLDTVLDAMTQALRKGDQITLVGFGTFVVRERKARSGRNPKTGETIQIPASKAVGFKPGKQLKDAVQK